MPLSLANSDKSLITTDKAVLSHLLSDAYVVNELPPANDNTCVIIDGMALVQSIGKPTTANTFGELADVYCRSVFRHFHGTCKRVDVIFDSYCELTIKGKTRERRSTKARKIRRIINSRSVQLPSSWSNFISLGDNKTNLIRFLAQELLRQAEDLPNDHELIVAGGWENPETTLSSTNGSSHVIT